MDAHRHKALYKENATVLSPRNNNQIIRNQQKAARAQQRKDNFHTNRLMFVNGSPEKVDLWTNTDKQLLTSTPFTVNGIKPKQTPFVLNKENIAVGCTSSKIKALEFNNNSPTTTCIAKVACAPKNEILTRKEAYLKRFVEWRNAQKAERCKKLESKQKPAWKPAVAPTSRTNSMMPSTKTTDPSFAAKNHKFQPPEGIKEVSANANPAKTKRPSLYVSVATPEKKTTAPTSIARKVLQQAHIMKNAGLVTFKNCAGTQKSEVKHQLKKTIPMTTATATVNNNKASVAGKTKVPTSINAKPPSFVNAKPANCLSAKSTKSTTPINGKPPAILNAKPKACVNTKTIKAATTVVEKPTKPKSTVSIIKATALTSRNQVSKPAVTNEVTRRLIKKPVSCPPPDETNSKKGAIGTVRVQDNRRVEAINKHKKPNLATSMKATKKPIVGNQINAATGFKRPPPKKMAEKIFLAIKADPAPTAETPKELNPINPFEKFVTSTKLKNDPAKECGESEISPIEFNDTATMMVNHKLSAGPSVKRTLLHNPDTKQTQQEPRKFNFEHYSVGNISEVDSLVSPLSAEMEQTETTIVMQKAEIMEPTPVKPISFDTDVTTVNNSLKEMYTTPPPKPESERPINYMSPFVTVSRGKVSAKAERERRNSMYMANGGDTPKKADLSDTPVTPVEVRRTLEAVRYFRKQLHDETVRLRGMCVQWEEYKSDNLARLLELGCDDKIDSTIGQTMLLTGNKFQQFNGLIERCAAGVTGESAVPDDGSEKTKHVSAIDLEGFWAMLGLQIENVEKRFAEIERWRANDWIDPDALVVQKPKTTNLANKVRKAKTKVSKPKASSGLVELMRKKHAELRKMKGSTVVANTLDTSQGRRSPPGSARCLTPRRRSIIVPNRKQFSPAATILTFKVEKASMGRCESLASTVGDVSVVAKRDLRKTVMLGSINNQTPQPQCASPKPRKSILKTPGTTKAARKSVLFSAKKSVRRFKFTFDDPTSSDEESKESETVANRCSDVNEMVEDSIADLTPIENSVKSNVLGVVSNGGTPRAYGLRNRKVKLRPSSEFVIPRK